MPHDPQRITETVDAEGRVTIPAHLRNKYGLAPGFKVVWIERDGEMVLCPVMAIRDLYGFLRPKPGEPSLTSVLLEERRSERER